MQITKLAHACVIIEKNGSRIIIDPGEYTQLPDNLENIAAVLITHHHADHLDDNNLKSILKNNPSCNVICNEESAAEISIDNVKAVKGSTEIQIAGFTILFEEHEHAAIYHSSPCSNLAITVDEVFYYPGDSYKLPSKSVKVVAVPMSGPWTLIANAIDFAKNSNAQIFFPTHNGHLNEIGQDSYNNWLKNSLENEKDKEWQSAEPFTQFQI